MKKNRSYLIRNSFFCLLFCLVNLPGFGQEVSFLPGISESLFRRAQLSGQGSLQNSLMIRSYAETLSELDSLKDKNVPHASSLSFKAGNTFRLILLPLTAAMQYNSNHPYGWNDDVLIPARGISKKISLGLQMDIGKFSVRLQPEFISSENKPFETFFTENYDTTWSRYYKWLNRSDIPEKFGDGMYQKIFPGQSSIRFTSGALSAGISTENMWWGPGSRNALVMSNNAPGFLHFTFNTVKPVQTKIGDFEWQLIAGELNNSGILPPERNRYYVNGGSPLYVAKKDEKRYISGLIVSWQPKWIKGLFVGFAKASYEYESDVNSIADIFPLEGIIKSSTEKNGRKASLGSLFARYVMPQEKMEVYMEYGRNDKSPNLINLATDSKYPRAYVAGVKKLFSSWQHGFIEFNAEFTQMQLPQAELIRNAQSWYTHDYVRQGYTNYGQVLGAGIGPGSNSEMLGIAWTKGIKRIGLTLERVVHNNDFYYNAFEESKDFRRHWTDLSTTLSAEWPYKKFVFAARMILTRSLNYEWWYFDYLPLTTPLNYFKNGYDVLNFQGAASLSYRF